MRKKKKKKKITLSFRTCCVFRFGVKQSRPSPGRYRGLTGAHTYPGAHVTQPQPDFFAFDGLLTFELYKLPPRRQKCNRREIVCKICTCDFFCVSLHPKPKTQTDG